jgi:hypothetical protein
MTCSFEVATSIFLALHDAFLTLICIFALRFCAGVLGCHYAGVVAERKRHLISALSHGFFNTLSNLLQVHGITPYG